MKYLFCIFVGLFALLISCNRNCYDEIGCNALNGEGKKEGKWVEFFSNDWKRLDCNKEEYKPKWEKKDWVGIAKELGAGYYRFIDYEDSKPKGNTKVVDFYATGDTQAVAILKSVEPKLVFDDGIMRWYHDNKKLSTQKEYKSGQPIWEKNFHKDGYLEHECSYNPDGKITQGTNTCYDEKGDKTPCLGTYCNSSDIISVGKVSEKFEKGVANLEEEGWQILYISVDIAKSDQPKRQTYPLSSSGNYGIIVIGDDDRIKDIDLEVFDDMGNSLGKDTEVKNFAVVPITISTSTSITCQVRAIDFEDNIKDGFYSLIIARK